MRPLNITYLGQALVTATWVVTPISAFADYTPPILTSTLTSKALDQGAIVRGATLDSSKTIDGEYYYYSGSNKDFSTDNTVAAADAKEFNPQWKAIFANLADYVVAPDRYNNYRNLLDANPENEQNVDLSSVINDSATHEFDVKDQDSNADSSKTYNFNDNISGDGSLIVKTSAEAYQTPLLSLNGNNDYQGSTTVKAGAKLNVDGRLNNSSVVVEEGGFFSGRGQVKALTVKNGATIFGYSLANPALLNPYEKTEDFKTSYANSLIVAGNLDLEQGAEVRLNLGQPLVVAGKANLNDNTLYVAPGTTEVNNGYFTGEVLVAANGIKGKFAEIKTVNSLLSVEGVAVVNTHDKKLHAINAIASSKATLQDYLYKAYNEKINKLETDANALNTLKSGITRDNEPSTDLEKLGVRYVDALLDTKTSEIKHEISKFYVELADLEVRKLDFAIENKTKEIERLRANNQGSSPEAQALESDIAKLSQEKTEAQQNKVDRIKKEAAARVNFDFDLSNVEKLKAAYLASGGTEDGLAKLNPLKNNNVLPNSLTSASSSSASNDSSSSTTSTEDQPQSLVLTLKSQSAVEAFKEDKLNEVTPEERDSAETIDVLRNYIPGLNADLSILTNHQIVETAELLYAPEYGQFISVANTANRLVRERSHSHLISQHDNGYLPESNGLSYNGSLAQGGEHGNLSVNQLHYFYNDGYTRFNAGFSFTRDSFKGTFSQAKTKVEGTGAYVNYGQYIPELNTLLTVGFNTNHFSGDVERRGSFLGQAKNFSKDFSSTQVSLDLGASQKFVYSLSTGSTLSFTPFLGVGITTSESPAVREVLGDYALEVKGGNQVSYSGRLGLRAEYKLNQAFSTYANYTLDYSSNSTKKVLSATVTELKGQGQSSDFKLKVEDKHLLQVLDFGVEYKFSDNFKASLYGEVLHRNGFTSGFGFQAQYSF